MFQLDSGHGDPTDRGVDGSGSWRRLQFPADNVRQLRPFSRFSVANPPCGIRLRGGRLRSSFTTISGDGFDRPLTPFDPNLSYASTGQSVEIGRDRNGGFRVSNGLTRKSTPERRLSHHQNVHFHYTPTHSSWLNQIEIWFSILAGQSLNGASFTGVAALMAHITSFIETYNDTARPFMWTKSTVHQKRLKPCFAVQ
jgi:hypothetical protein